MSDVSIGSSTKWKILLFPSLCGLVPRPAVLKNARAKKHDFRFSSDALLS
jgi:hypothetical protein